MGQTIEDASIGVSLLLQMHNDVFHKNVHIKTQEGKVVQAHSTILASASQKFKTVFEEKAFGIYNLSTPQVSYTTWKLVLEFLYTGCITLPKHQQGIDALASACQGLDITPLLLHVNSFVSDPSKLADGSGNSPLSPQSKKKKYGALTLTRTGTSPVKRQEGGSFVCEICNQSCHSFNALRAHRGHHTRQRTLHGDSGQTTSMTEGEEAGTKQKKNFECSTCHLSFGTNQALMAHRTHHLRSRKNSFGCDLCDRVFHSPAALGSHRRVHQESGSEVSSKGAESGNNQDQVNGNSSQGVEIESLDHLDEHQCTQCDLKFASRKALAVHVGYHGRKGFVCKFCGRKCLKKEFLERHIAKAHSKFVNPGMIKAKRKYNILGKNALQRKKLNQMIKGKQGLITDNTDWSGLKCPICDDGFTKPQLLSAHLIFEHAGSTVWRKIARTKRMAKALLPPYWKDYCAKKCIPCDIEFKQCSNFLDHQRETHNDDYPYKCSLCDGSYRTHVGLQTHVVKVHLPHWRGHICHLCDHSSDRMDKLKAHYVKAHPNEPMREVSKGPKDADMSKEEHDDSYTDVEEGVDESMEDAAENGVDMTVKSEDVSVKN